MVLSHFFIKQDRDDAYHLVDVLPNATTTGWAIGIQCFHLLAHESRNVRGRRLTDHAQPHFIGCIAAMKCITVN